MSSLGIGAPVTHWTDSYQSSKEFQESKSSVDPGMPTYMPMDVLTTSSALLLLYCNQFSSRYIGSALACSVSTKL